MLVIRAEQIAVLENAAGAVFEAQAVVHLRGAWAEWTRHLRSEDLHALVRGGMARAQAHGFSERYDIVCFIELTVAFTPQLETGTEHMWARILLAERDGPAWMRRERLLEEARERAPSSAPFGTFPGRAPVAHLGA